MAVRVGPGVEMTVSEGPGVNVTVRIGPGVEAAVRFGPGVDVAVCVGPGMETAIGPGFEKAVRVGPGMEAAVRVGPGLEATVSVRPGLETAVPLLPPFSSPRCHYARCEKKCCEIETFPLRMAIGLTRHKAQGMTIAKDEPFEKAVLHFPTSATKKVTVGLKYPPSLDLQAPLPRSSSSEAPRPLIILFLSGSPTIQKSPRSQNLGTRRRHNTGRSFLNTCFGNPGHFSLGIKCSVGLAHCLEDLDTTLLPENTRSV